MAVAVAVGKGVWTGIWILYVIWPALLLFHLARRAGLDGLGPFLSSVLPTETENVLLVAWVLPSFIQGVAGFGTPIAVAAPLLLAMGIPKVRAVALPLIGYHWSVTFGSMGSSFYMGALTASVEGIELERYAHDAALMLGINLFVAGGLVALMLGGTRALREGGPMIAITGSAMAVGLYAAVHVEPALGSLAAGAAGLASVVVLRAVRRRGPSRHTTPVPRPTATVPPPTIDGSPAQEVVAGSVRVGQEVAEEAAVPRARPLVLLLPYAYLLVLVLLVFVPQGSRAWVKAHGLVGPSFGVTRTSFGLENAAEPSYNPIELLGHPGSYLVLAALLGLATYRIAGAWPRGSLRPTLHDWLHQALKSSVSVIGLAVVATVMVESGMVRMIAVGVAEATGGAFPVGSPFVGMVGSFTTGSTTSSNALFAALQRDIALLIGVSPSELLAAQTTGGNIGNALAPVVLLIGATAVGAADRVREIFRTVLPPAMVLLAVTIIAVLVLLSTG